MKSYLVRVFEEFEKITLAHECELIQHAYDSGAGLLVAMNRGSFAAVAKVRYELEATTVAFDLDERGNKRFTIGDPKVSSVFSQWEELLDEKLTTVQT